MSDMYEPYFNDPPLPDDQLPSRYGPPKKTEPEKVKKPVSKVDMDVWKELFKKRGEDEKNME